MPPIDLTQRQRDLLGQWLPDAELVADLSWPSRLTQVARVRSGGLDAVVKASTPVMHAHIRREIRAHRELARAAGGPLRQRLIGGDDDAHLLALTYLPGTLAEGTTAEHEPSTFAAAGAALARLHGSEVPGRGPSLEYAADRATRLAARLSAARPLVGARLLARASDAVATLRPEPEELVPTHGDSTPRNWLVLPDGALALIDFGRYDLRPWYTDVVRIWGRYGSEATAALLAGLEQPEPWRGEPALRRAWLAETVYQALATVVWASDVGDEPFADEGRQMLELAVDS